ncbi:MAG: hypothetical protein IPM46_09905 [Flavobacteriales bacterium]|nr:hypothetical protein [Flavobacteriales bacterium]
MNSRNLISRTLVVLACSSPMVLPTAAAANKEVIVNAERLSSLPAAERSQVLDLQRRMETLIATDRAALTREQRRELRSEWRSMKHEMNDINARNGGTVVYISTAGIIIILLLLIILL